MVWGDFYVIPVNKKIEHVILVAKKGGDFTDVKAAMDSITDASENNRYLVYVGPGEYEVTAPIVLKEWVTLKGSGQTATLIQGNISDSGKQNSAIIVGASYAMVTELTIKNRGGSGYSIGIYNDNLTNMKMENITVYVWGGSYNSYAIFNSNASYIKMSNMEIFAYDVASVNTKYFGIYSFHSSYKMNNVEITAFNGVESYGVYNFNSSPKLSNTKIMAMMASNHNYGIYNRTSSIPTMTNVTVKASGTGSVGVYTYDDSASPKIYHSIVDGGVSGGSPICYYTLGIEHFTINSQEVTIHEELNATCGI